MFQKWEFSAPKWCVAKYFLKNISHVHNHIDGVYWTLFSNVLCTDPTGFVPLLSTLYLLHCYMPSIMKVGTDQSINVSRNEPSHEGDSLIWASQRLSTRSFSSGLLLLDFLFAEDNFKNIAKMAKLPQLQVVQVFQGCEIWLKIGPPLSVCQQEEHQGYLRLLKSTLLWSFFLLC